MNNSLISVVIPTRNRGNLLRQALASCALQTWPNREIIVVDDGSEEDIRAVVAETRQHFALGDSLHYVRQEPLGGNAARNLGIARTTGEFVQLLDSDDLLHPDKFRLQAERLTAVPDLDMVYCQDEHFRECPGDMRRLWNVPVAFPGRDDLDRFLYGDAVWSTGSPLWRRSSLLRIGVWDEGLICWQDWEFFIKALCTGIRYESSNNILFYIRQHDGPRSFQSQTQLKMEQSRVQAGKLVAQYLSAAGLFSFGRRLLLTEYFLERLQALSEIEARDATALRADVLVFMKGFSLTGKQKACLSTLAALNRTVLFKPVFQWYKGRFPTDIHPGKLRDIVQAFDSAPPPAEFWKQVFRSGAP